MSKTRADWREPFVGEVEAITERSKQQPVEQTLADRERELLQLKGPCPVEGCRLHRDHPDMHDVRV